MNRQSNGNERLRVAVQKSGRLTDKSLDLFRKCGLEFSRDPNHLICYGENLPVDLWLVRDDDIPQLIDDGDCHAGIVGENVAEEHRLSRSQAGTLTARCQLDFGYCRLTLAAPEASPIRNVKQFEGARIATSYPGLLGNFLKKSGVHATVVHLTGAVELAPEMGRAEGICDLVSTGETLRSHGLIELQTIMESRAIWLVDDRARDRFEVLTKIERRIAAVMAVNESKYIMLHAPVDSLKEIRRLLPGAEAPTILPLDGDKKRVAVHAVCRESIFWETLEALRGAGASAVLVLPLEKMLL